ncbi:hypothetical protein Syun_012727 [Stephania yunnanensis]|uniref:Uncharacterized protein n=1 Tax=Stephania yunnanensis TaxID=152371 RepID=A0AAP0K2B1_9MAGN
MVLGNIEDPKTTRNEPQGIVASERRRPPSGRARDGESWTAGGRGYTIGVAEAAQAVPQWRLASARWREPEGEADQDGGTGERETARAAAGERETARARGRGRSRWWRLASPRRLE